MAAPVTMPERNHLASEFIALLQPFSSTPSALQKWTSLLQTAYNEPQRHYHTISHVSSMLQHLSVNRPLITNVTAVGLKIIFHDWVYIPESIPGYNEEQSVARFLSFAAELGLPQPLVTLVSHYIKATITHSLSGDRDETDGDLRLFLDFDLEVLGRERGVYELYSGQIREEYRRYNDETYTKGRIGVLESFLRRDRLFFSKGFFEAYEREARGNLEWEIGILAEVGEDSVRIECEEDVIE